MLLLEVEGAGFLDAGPLERSPVGEVGEAGEAEGFDPLFVGGPEPNFLVGELGNACLLFVGSWEVKQKAMSY
jgi:hypothetical protein